ncbi:assembly protein for periplasmic nitrate reductase [Cedecea lapagei]|uniref:Chaperone NapD n=1 Tax=Cedecea lapagei TaxID=158823 RepID=A0A447UZ97_9ENTR|nr:chaperone NapD [Cedecea lapagei]VEB96010.1 assembly protein for periplasmic nitrate reductase [Cedecea lapagei]
MHTDWHVCGLVVQAKPEHVAAVRGAINALPGSEVAVDDADSGKLVVVIEASRSSTLLEQIERARNISGVLAVSLVYHQQNKQGEEAP